MFIEIFVAHLYNPLLIFIVFLHDLMRFRKMVLLEFIPNAYNSTIFGIKFL